MRTTGLNGLSTRANSACERMPRQRSLTKRCMPPVNASVTTNMNLLRMRCSLFVAATVVALADHRRVEIADLTQTVAPQVKAKSRADRTIVADRI
jgi:hypothetical protein